MPHEARREQTELGLFPEAPPAKGEVLAGTGHRPEKLRIGRQNAYDDEVLSELVQFVEGQLVQLEPRSIITGMALGWDTALALAAQNQGIPYHAYVPFEGQERRWPEPAKKRYRALLRNAASVRVVSDGGYAAWKMHARNGAMVEDADRLLALHDGSAGGTQACLKEAERRGRPVTHLWSAWCEHVRRLAASCTPSSNERPGPSL